MPKITKSTLIYVLAFFIFATFLTRPLNAQDARTFENGLRVIVREDHRNAIVVFSAFIDIGAASEGQYLGSGLSHLIEHMLFKGTKKYPQGAIEDILHKYGGKIDAFTSHDYTGLRIVILKEHMAIGLDVLKEMLTLPTFDLKELEKEQKVIEREMDFVRDDPGKRISRMTFSNAYTRHPYRIPVIGYKENFKELDRADLVGFFKTHYVPEKTVVAIVGDIDKEQVFSKVEDIFGKIKRGRNRVHVVPEEPQQIAENYVEEARDIGGAYLNIAFHSTALMDRDLYALDLLSFILGQGEGSILNENIRLKKKLVTSIASYNYTPKDPGLFIVSGILKEGDVKHVIEEIIKELDIVKEKGVTEEEIERAKNNLLTAYIYQKETIESQANDLALGELLTGNPRFFELYIEHIKAVTVFDVQRVAAKYLTRQNMTVACLSRSGNALDLSKDTFMQKGERDELKKITLENNLPVIISRTTSLPILSISLLFKGGLRFESEANNGISRIVSLVFMDGVEDKTRQEIAWFYESKGMSVTTYSANNSLGISINCLKEHLDDALRLLSEVSMSATVPEEELEREKMELGSIIDMQDNAIVNHGHRLLKGLLFETHPYRFQTTGSRESIDRIKRGEVLEFYRAICSADNMVLGIAGDCNVEEVEALAGKYFSGIPKSTRKRLATRRELPMDDSRQMLVDVERKQSLILIGFHGADIYDKDRYALELIMDILSRESGILFKEIRGARGLSYAQGAFQVMGIDPGYITIYALTSKENVKKVKDIIFKEIASFIKKGVSLEELQKSKNYLKAMRKIAMQTNAHFIFTAILDELYGLGYNNYKDYDKNIDIVMREDIKRVAEDFLTLGRCAIIILEGNE